MSLVSLKARSLPVGVGGAGDRRSGRERVVGPRLRLLPRHRENAHSGVSRLSNGRSRVVSGLNSLIARNACQTVSRGLNTGSRVHELSGFVSEVGAASYVLSRPSSGRHVFGADERRVSGTPRGVSARRSRPSNAMSLIQKGGHFMDVQKWLEALLPPFPCYHTGEHALRNRSPILRTGTGRLRRSRFVRRTGGTVS